MAAEGSTPRTRREDALRALAELGRHRSDHQVLAVTCSHSHHLAYVYDTPGGLLLVARTGPHAHGRRDLPDQGHKGAPQAEEYATWVRRDEDVPTLPAWCDCGPRELSPELVLEAVEASQKRLSLN